jgi:hypothetical protein
LPSESYLIIEGQLRKADHTAYAAADEVSLINNAMMYLFNSISYDIGGNNMEKIDSPGQITSMLGYLSYPDDYNTCAGLMSCWSKDTTANAVSKRYNQSPAVAANSAITAGHFTPIDNPDYNQGFAARRALLMSADPPGSFSFLIPFDHVFGFGSYNKVIYNIKHSLKFVRNSSNNLAIY